MSADGLFDRDPSRRRSAARALKGRERRQLLRRAAGWPAWSPGALNAWLLIVTTKAPAWSDPLLAWRESEPTLGHAHEGFLYPDPLGFWAEVRHWATTLVGVAEPAVRTPDALAVTALVHVGGSGALLQSLLGVVRPAVVLFADEAGWAASAFAAHPTTSFGIPDPHRPGVTYVGQWGRTADGVIVGKAPQHPAAHQLYRRSDMDAFLREMPSRA